MSGTRKSHVQETSGWVELADAVSTAEQHLEHLIDQYHIHHVRARRSSHSYSGIQTSVLGCLSCESNTTHSYLSVHCTFKTDLKPNDGEIGFERDIDTATLRLALSTNCNSSE